MNLVIGPVLRRVDGYAFDTWTAGKGVTRSYPYHRVEHAYYARNAEIKASVRGRAPAAIVCQTLDEFVVKLTGDEVGPGLRDIREARLWPPRHSASLAHD
jgi:hypothetical protein